MYKFHWRTYHFLSYLGNTNKKIHVYCIHRSIFNVFTCFCRKLYAILCGCNFIFQHLEIPYRVKSLTSFQQDNYWLRRIYSWLKVKYYFIMTFWKDKSFISAHRSVSYLWRISFIPFNFCTLINILYVK